jgi:LPS sulfotransferase NodH
VWPYLRERTDIKIIHLKRRNLLQTHLSRKRAALTDKWVNTSGRADSQAPVTLDYEECLKDFVQTKAWEEESERYFPHHSMLQVHYEGLASDYAAEARTIQDFLEVQPETVKPTTFQQTRQPLRSMIANYDDLKRQFRGTVWQEFFTD